MLSTGALRVQQTFCRRQLLSTTSWSRLKLASSLTNDDGSKSNGKVEDILNRAAIFDADELNQDQTAFRSSAYPRLSSQDVHQRISAESYQPIVLDDSKNSVLLFPGQGSQFVGMGSKLLDVPNVKEMYEKASSILGYDLLKLCTHGPANKLDQTEFCQPALLVTSLAAVEKLFHEKPEAIQRCIATAGFSLGEITALTFSGAFSFDDGVRLAKIRGEAMQYCSQLVSSGMLTVFHGSNAKLALATEVAEKWCKQKFGMDRPVCKLANYLYQGAKVIAGHEEALQFIENNASDFGIRRTKRLPVSGAFHTPLMEPAVEILREALLGILIQDPNIPVYSNRFGTVYTKAGHVRKKLPGQIVVTCKWEQVMNKLFTNYQSYELQPSIYECGPGAALSAILKKINQKVGNKAVYVPV